VVDTKLACARIRFLSSYVAAAADHFNSSKREETMKSEKEEEKILGNSEEEDNMKQPTSIPVIPMSSCLLSLKALVKSGLLQHSIGLVSNYAFVLDWSDIMTTATSSSPLLLAAKGMNNKNDYNKMPPLLQEEATACALVKDCLSLLLFCRDNSNYHGDIDDDVQTLISSLTTELREIILESLQAKKKNTKLSTVGTEEFSESKDTDKYSSTHYARMRWLNGAHFALCKFLLSSFPSSLSCDGFSLNASICKAFGYSLLGRLQRGDEAKAAIILSQDILFDLRDQHSPVTTESVESPIQSTLLRELCTTKLSQAQLDHSFKLQHGGGISPSSGMGPFSLESLRMDVDRRDPPLLSDKSKDDGSASSSPVSDLIIPLGRLWLWHMISSTIRPVSSQDESGLGTINENATHQNVGFLQEAFGVVASSLQLMLAMEEDCELRNYYAGNINTGAKLYHLINVCLYPEEALRDERITPLLVTLFDKYTSEERIAKDDLETITKTTLSCRQSFASACYLHSRSSQAKKKKRESIYKSNTTPKATDEEKITALLDETKSGSKNNPNSSGTNEIKCLEEFVGDMCNAYLEYGAQYDCFTQCMRYFLTPGFPPKIIAGLIQRLRGFLHLLTTEEESNNISGPAIARSLYLSLSGGLPGKDGSKRDSADILDTFSMALKGDDCHLTALHGGYFYLLSVAYIARNLASSSQGCECGVQASKRRMKGLRAEVLDHIVKTATRLLSSEAGRKDDLVQAVFDSCVHNKNLPASFNMNIWPSKNYDSLTWENMIKALQNISKN